MNAISLSLLVLAVAGLLLIGWGLYRRKEQPGEVHSYFEHLRGEYHALPEDPSREKSFVDHIESILKEKKDDVNWDHIFQLELLLLKLMPEEKLLRKAWLIRKRWKSVVSSEALQSYEDSLKNRPAPEHPTSSRQELLADLEVLLQDLFWHYRMNTAWEEQSGRFANTGLVYLLLTLLGAGVLFKLVSLATLPLDWNTLVLAFAVAFTGAVGGFMSMLRRLKEASAQMHRSSQLIAIESSRTAIILQSMLTGGAFALVLWLMFLGGLLSGELFPKEITSPLTSPIPKDLAKLLVWSFIAGFAERFVPDLLDKLGAKGQGTSAEKEKQETAKPQPRPPQGLQKESAEKT